MPKLPSVVFFALRELHVPVLLPVYRELTALGFTDIGFCAPPYTVGREGQLQEGMSDVIVGQLRESGVAFWGERPPHPVSCVVTADSCYDRIDGWGPIVCVGHGTISKGFYYTNLPFVRKENFATTLCVPGPWYATSFGLEVFTRVAVTGFSRMDELARLGPADRELLLRSIGFSPRLTTILYAPTFNYELTSMIDLFGEWSKIDTSRYQVIFKLHGATIEKLKNYYKVLAQNLRGFHYAQSIDVSPYLNACDLVVSDVSSVYVEAFAVDKPVIVYNSPLMRQYPAFHPAAVEFAVRDAAYQIERPADLHKVLERVRLEDPLAGRRRHYARALFVPLDGKNSARIAQEIRNVACGQTKRPWPSDHPNLWIYLPSYIRYPKLIHENIGRMAGIACVVTRYAAVERLGKFEVRHLREGESIELPAVILTGEVVLPYEWDFLYNMELRYHPAAGIYGPLLPDNAAFGPQQHRLVRGPWPYPAKRCQSLYKYGLYDRVKSVEFLCPDGLFITHGMPPAFASSYIERLNDPQMQRAFAAEAKRRGFKVGVMEGVVALLP